MILSIDAGHAFGGNACTLLDPSYGLQSVWFERFTGGPLKLEAHQDVVLVEKPEYQGARSDMARTQDLINLSWSGALLAGAYAARHRARLVELTPSEWKGQEHKAEMHSRLWSILDASERQVLGGDKTKAQIDSTLNKWIARRKKGRVDYPASFKTHNLLDAAALGCVWLGRMPGKLKV